MDQKFIEDAAAQEGSPLSVTPVLWRKLRSVSWAEFLQLLTHYCHSRGWDIVYDSAQDGSCTIFVNDEKKEESEALQARLLFDDLDALPF